MKVYQSAIFISLHQAGCVREAQSWEKLIRASTQQETMESAWSKEVLLLCKFRLMQSQEVLFFKKNLHSDIFCFLLDSVKCIVKSKGMCRSIPFTHGTAGYPL